MKIKRKRTAESRTPAAPKPSRTRTDGGKVWLRNEECAKLLGIARSHFDKTIAQHVDESDKKMDGRWRVFSGRAVVSAYLKSLQGPGGGDIPASENEWATRRSRAMALTAEREFEVMDKKYLPVAEVEARESSLASTFKNSFMALPIRLSPMLVGLSLQEIERKLREHAIQELNSIIQGENT